jgi:hypothetical protein
MVNGVIAADARLTGIYAGPMTAGGDTGRNVTSPENASHHGSPPPAAPYATPGPEAPRPRRGGGSLVGIGIAVAVVLAAAALVISLVTAHHNSSTLAAQPTSQPTNQAAATTDSDKALCQAIAPLIKESSQRGDAFVSLGHTGTPERDAGISSYVADTTDCVRRAQAVLDEHSRPASPPGFLMRSLQRYVDDKHAYAASIRPGPATEADNAAWNDSLVALSGPFDVCDGVGVPLW